MHSERFNLDFPDDFPVAAVEAIHGHVTDRDQHAPEAIEWKEWASAMNGVMFRFLACSEHGVKAMDSLRRSTAPPPLERLDQEKWLFGFFFEGLSSLECAYYGLYFIGVLAEPDAFDVNRNRKDIGPWLVASLYGTAFANEPLAQRLAAVLSTTDYEQWRDIRNILGHRGTPGRGHFVGGDRAEQVDWHLPVDSLDVSTILEPSELERRRAWLGSALCEILEAADAFVHAHVR